MLIALLMSFQSQAVMVRTVVIQFVIESGAACVLNTGESADKVPLSDQLDMLKSMRHQQGSEGDTVPTELDEAYNSNFAETVQLVDGLKKEGPVDCKYVMEYTFDKYKKKLHADDMRMDEDGAYFDNAITALRKLDHEMASDYK